MTIPEIIAAAETTSNTWTNKMTNGMTHSILTFGNRDIAASVGLDLWEAGAQVTIERSAYGEYIMTVIYNA